MSDIFSGNNSANPMEICDALGWSGDLKQEDIVGAVMSLCRTVAAQSSRIDSLCEELVKLRGPGHGMTVAAERDFLSQALNEGDGGVSAMTPNVLGEGPPERRSRGGNQQAQLVGGPSRPAG